MRTEADHVEEYPSWNCRTCGAPWPCPSARRVLLAEMDLTQLRIYLWLKLEQAVEDLPARPPAELFHRFLSWTSRG